MDKAKEIYQLFIKHKAVFPHIRFDYLKRMLVKRQIITCYEEEGRLVGALVWMQYKVTASHALGCKGDIQIKQIVVDPAEQGRCVAGGLFDVIEHIARKRNASRLCLSVRASNRRACRFYEKMGMQKVGERVWKEKGQDLPGYVYVKNLVETF